MSPREVLYSCGQCGYPLKLCSSDRIVGVGADYLKENKKGKICFLNFDESRFKQHDELKSKHYSLIKNLTRLYEELDE
ncbi:hypothetical protein R1flu_004988 [Riccia fluitans]|uniref:Uncharacterized protein n=1 Tax=Riccia fluitans TaxID=41844 RepID=A0ABD1YSV1_9MARC